MSKRSLVTLSLVAGVLALGGCAHPISIAPDIQKLRIEPPPVRSDKPAGFVMSEAFLATEVESPGGGGDRVKYQPYRDLEAGLYAVLTQHFASVTRLQTTSDPKISSQGVQRVFVPAIKTDSSSSSAFTWPPTHFKVEMSCQVFDGAGRSLGQVAVTGEGQAVFDEFKNELGLSARRASEDALRKLSRALADMPALR